MAGITKQFGIAVLGLGRMGQIHARSLLLNPRARLEWLVRQNVKAAQNFVDMLQCSAQCASPAQLDMVLKDDRVDGIVICSPTLEHEPAIKAAIDAGKAVFCEKPITAEVETTQACYEMAEAKKLPLLCAFHRRFDPSFMAVKASLAAGERGRLRMVRSSSHDLNPPPLDYIKVSGGIFKDSTIHDLDMALWLSASRAKKVYVQGSSFDPGVRSVGDLDLVVVSIEHESGSISVVDNGRRCAHGYDQRLEVLCEEGSYLVSNQPVHQLVQHSASSSLTPPIDQCFTTRYHQAYANEMEHFLDVLEGIAEPKVSKEEVLSAMKLAEAATVSARMGKVVELDS